MTLFLLSSVKKYSVYPVKGLALILLLAISFSGGISTVKAEDKAAAKPAEQNKEIEALKERLGQLEERFINMQSRLGTIESLAKQGASMGAGSSAAATQSSPYGSSNAGSSHQDAYGDTGNGSMNGGAGDAQMRPSAADETGQGMQNSGQPPAPIRSRPRRINSDGEFKPFGDQSSMQPAPQHEGSRAIAQQEQNQGRRDVRQKVKVVHAPDGLDSSSPKKLYQESYRMLLKPDYSKAESGFSYFLQQFPHDKRASNAQYWLGEAYFVQKKYKRAANAYLKGYKKYPNSTKAPDSFLKLAVSLNKLGQKEAACATFKAFPAKYPNATSYVNQRHKIMLGKAGC